MNFMKKYIILVITGLCLVIGMKINVKAEDNYTRGIGDTIAKQFSKDSIMAREVANMLGEESVDTILTEAMVIGVTDMNLYSTSVSDLSGIEIFKNLERLNVYVCPKLKRLPDSLVELESLEEIIINETGLETIPNNIGAYPSLKSLTIHNSEITAIPESIGALSTLEELVINNTKITKIPDSIRKLENIKYISLNVNQIIDLTVEQAAFLLDLENGGTATEQAYSLQDKQGYLNTDYVLKSLPIYAQNVQYPTPSSFTYLITFPDDPENPKEYDESDANSPIRRKGGKITLDKSLLTQEGEHQVVVSLLDTGLAYVMNGSEYTHKFTVKMSEPELVLLGNSTIEIQEGTVYKEPGFIVNDPSFDDLEDKVIIDYGGLDIKNPKPGTYTITYSVTNPNGKTATATRIVVVKKKETSGGGGTTNPPVDEGEKNPSNPSEVVSNSNNPKTADNSSFIWVLAALGSAVFIKKKSNN